MSKYLDYMSNKHEVIHEFSGKRHFFKVSTPKKDFSVSIELHCDCEFMGTKGIANSKICSHILAVFKKIVKNGEIKKSKNQ